MFALDLALPIPAGQNRVSGCRSNNRFHALQRWEEVVTRARSKFIVGVSINRTDFSAKQILLDDSMSRTPGPGRPSKGERDSFFTRPAAAVGKVIRANADALGMPYGEYISACVAQFLDMTEHAHNRRLH